jgi:hypothetical protein
VTVRADRDKPPAASGTSRRCALLMLATWVKVSVTHPQLSLAAQLCHAWLAVCRSPVPDDGGSRHRSPGPAAYRGPSYSGRDRDGDRSVAGGLLYQQSCKHTHSSLPAAGTKAGTGSVTPTGLLTGTGMQAATGTGAGAGQRGC